MTVSWRGARSRAIELFLSPRLRQAHQPQPWQMARDLGVVPDRECRLHDAARGATHRCAGLRWLTVTTQTLES